MARQFFTIVSGVHLPPVLILSSVSASVYKDALSWVECSVHRMVLSKLSLKRVMSVSGLAPFLLRQDVQLAEECVLKTSGLWLLLHIVWDGAAGFTIVGPGDWCDNTKENGFVIVERGTCALYVYFRCSIYRFQPPWGSAPWSQRCAMTFLFGSLTWPLASAYYAVVVNFLTNKRTVTVSTNLDRNYSPLSISKKAGSQCLTIQFFGETISGLLRLLWRPVLPCSTFKHLPVKTVLWWLPDFYLRNGTNIFIATNSNGPAAGDRRNSLWWRFSLPCSGHDGQPAPVPYGLLAIWGQ